MLCLLSYFTSSLRRLGGTEDVAVRSPGRKDDRLASPEIRPAARRPCSCAIGATHRRPGQRPGGTTLPNQKRLTAGITDVRRLPKGSGEMTCPVRAQMRMWTQAPGRCPGLRWTHPLRGEKDKTRKVNQPDSRARRSAGPVICTIECTVSKRRGDSDLMA